MVLDQISANLRMIPSNVLENLSKSNNLISDEFMMGVQVPCSKHRPPEAEAGDLAQFVLRCCAEDAYYTTGPGGEDR